MPAAWVAPGPAPMVASAAEAAFSRRDKGDLQGSELRAVCRPGGGCHWSGSSATACDSGSPLDLLRIQELPMKFGFGDPVA